ncbi:MAG: flagellar motor protein MotB [Clostridium sp.]|jgi:chemotaxis protein MotB|nr:flagellar motor protein MotB [Clostridium sp.]
MARKKQEEEAGGGAAWLATFSDLNNLLLCFFVMLFAMSTIDVDKLKAAAESIQTSMGIFDGGQSAIGEGILISSGVSQLPILDEYLNNSAKTSEGDDDPKGNGSETNEGEKTAAQLQAELDAINLAQNEQTMEAMEEALSEAFMSEQVELSVTADFVQLSMDGAFLFDSGQAKIRQESEAVLQQIGLLLERYAKGTIEVEGHTDNVPINNSRFADNEELSSARAVSVFYYLRDNTLLSPAKIKHSGRGENVPIADNATPEGRARNRRVEIKLYNSIM